MNNLNWRKLNCQLLLDDLELRANWDRLSAQRLDLPFMCVDAVTTALSVFGSGQERLFVATVDGSIAAMFILVPSGSFRWRTFQVPQLPLGAWVAARDLKLQNLCRSLIDSQLGLCLVLSITQIDPLYAPRLPDQSDNWHFDYINTAWIEVEGNFDDYWASRGKNLRQNMRKQRNKLAAEGTVTTMQMLRKPEEMMPAIERYGTLESKGWKSDGGTAIHPNNDQGRFYTQLLEGAARHGQAVVFEYLFDNNTAAINLCLERNGVLAVLKTTYDESLPKTLSPAFLLREEELQHIFAAHQIRRIEYYGRIMEWHTKLTDNSRTLYHLTVYRKSFVKKFAQRRRAAAAAAALDADSPNTPATTPPA